MTPSSINNLTDAEVNERIAVACGIPTGSRTCCGGSYDLAVPDYLNDLNAMAAAEATLTDKAHGRYRTILQEVVNPKCGMLMTSAQYRAWFSATAKQRAEAFLATIAP